MTTPVVLPNTSKSASDANNFSDVYANDLALKNAVDAIADGTGTDLPDSALASPNNSAYKTLLTATVNMGTDTAAGTYGFGTEGIFTSTSNVISSGTPTSASVGVPSFVHFTAADHTVAALTNTLQLHAAVLANATQPTITFTVGLYPVTVAGAADALTVTLGTVVTGSTVAIASPAASTVTRGTAATAIAVPTNGLYCFGVVTSAQLTNNNASLVSAQLQLHSA